MGIMINLFAAITFSISSLSTTSNALELEVTKNEINDAIESIASFDFSNNSNDDIEDNLKIGLVDYYDEHDYYVSKPLLNDLKDYLKNNDFNFVDGSILSMQSLPRLDLQFKNFEGHGNIVSDLEDSLPVYSYDSTEAKVSYQSILDGRPFIGINISKDACVAIYNTFSTIIETYDFFGDLLLIIKGTTYSAISSLIMTVLSYIKGVFVSFWAAIPSGFIGTLFKTLIVFVAAGVAAVLAAAFVYGFMQQGFYIGFICNSLFDWDFVCGVYEC